MYIASIVSANCVGGGVSLSMFACRFRDRHTRENRLVRTRSSCIATVVPIMCLRNVFWQIDAVVLGHALAKKGARRVLEPT